MHLDPHNFALVQGNSKFSDNTMTSSGDISMLYARCSSDDISSLPHHKLLIMWKMVAESLNNHVEWDGGGCGKGVWGQRGKRTISCELQMKRKKDVKRMKV